MLGQVFNIAPRSVCCDGNPSCLPSRVCNRGNSKKVGGSCQRLDEVERANKLTPDDAFLSASFPQLYIVLKGETKTSYTNVTHAPLYSTRPTPRR